MSLTVPANLGYRKDLAAVHAAMARMTMVRQQGAVDFADLAPKAMATARRVFAVGPAASTIHQDVRSVNGGNFLPAQFQNRGTCTSRGLKRVLDLLQLMQIRAGMAATFNLLSHAVIYGLGREVAGMLGGNPSNESDDGCTGSAVGQGVVKGGDLCNADDQDDDNNDTLACEWGARGVPADVKAKAKGHLVTGMAAINSVADAKAAILSGRACTIASDVDYTGGPNGFERDANGVCYMGGHNWPHQMCLTGYTDDLNGKGPHFLQDQSWGPNQPGGPIGPVTIPTYSFWCREQDVAEQIGQGDCWTFAGIEGWNSPLLTWVV